MYFCSDTSEFLPHDRTVLANRELWRLLTVHFKHWSFDHCLWFAVTFIALGSICEQLNRKGFILSLVASAIIIPVVGWFADPDMQFYRGLSGICSSIFVAGSILMIRKALAEKNRAQAILPAVGGILFCIKILYEFISAQTVYVHSNNMFSPVPLAHLAGGNTGLITVSLILFRAQK